MALTAAHVQPYMGRQIVVQSNYGMHSGVLHEIRTDGIVLRNARVMNVSGSQMKLDALTADQPGQLQAEEAFWPFFFLPWLALFALWPLAFWW